MAWESIVIDARFEWYEIFDGQHEAGETMQKVVHKEGVGKCTLAGNLHSSIPMPRGATPPLRPPNRAKRTAAKCLARRGRKRTAEANKTVILGIAV